MLFVAVYRQAGTGIDERPLLQVAGLVLLVVVYALLLWFLRSVSGAETADLIEGLLNLVYPLLNFLILVPSLMLLRMTVVLRGGAVWKAWMSLVLGILLTVAGDILAVYVFAAEASSLSPLYDLMYAWGYVLVARATAMHYAILSGPRP